MKGLLDFLQTPAGVGLLSGIGSYAAGAQRRTPVNNVGRGVLGGLMGYQQANTMGREDEQQKLANELRTMQMGQLRQTMSDDAENRGMYKEIGAMMNPPKIPATPESTRFNIPFNLNPESPRTDFSTQTIPGLPERPGVIDQQAIKARYAQSPEGGKVAMANMFKENVPLKLGKDDRLVDPKTFQQLMGAAPSKIDYNKPFLPDGAPNTAFQDYSMRNRKAGASNISVSATGQKEAAKSLSKPIGDRADASLSLSK